MYQDKTITCKECGTDFIFSAGEQEFYAERGFQNEPQRCKECRWARNKNNARPEREMFIATCASCGQDAKVPFKPTEGRDVFCSECFAKMKDA
ncbi:MAG: zinc-ribbon domain containing protein [Clostridia bacterium]